MQKSSSTQMVFERASVIERILLGHEFSKDAARLCRLAANVLEAHTVSLYLPILDKLHPVAWQTMAPQSVQYDPLSFDHGLIGWVAKNKKPIHVSPFERDSKILGMYKEDLQLKSCMGVPVHIGEHNQVAGVLNVDSKKAFAFSKLQGKLLEDIAEECTALISLHASTAKAKDSKTDFSQFKRVSQELISHIGIESVAVLRTRASNFSQVETELGLASATQLFESFSRLVQQALPPKYPMYVTPTGDLLCIVDSMMVDSYTNKFLVISEHPSLRGRNGVGFSLDFRARSFMRGERQSSLEALIHQTAFIPEPLVATSTQTVIEEPRRRLFAFR